MVAAQGTRPGQRLGPAAAGAPGRADTRAGRMDGTTLNKKPVTRTGYMSH